MVGDEAARRIAVHAQLLDGSATSVLETVRRLGYLQIDPISSVAPPQRLVLWSRLGPYDTSELDRLLWEERKLIEWRAFIYPIETLPLLRARMRSRNGLSPNGREFLREHASFRRTVLRDLERRGPLLGREIHDPKPRAEKHRWWGSARCSGARSTTRSRARRSTAGGARGAPA
jgi:uncharacterized protein YcaQ